MTDTVPATVPQNRAIAASNQVALHQPQRDMLEFGTIAEVMKFAEMIQRAEGAIPKRCLGNPGMIVATVMAGHELGIGPMASLRAFHVVEGKPTADYSFWIARLKAAGYKVEWPERGDERVTLKLTAPDGTSAQETWTKARAITAGLWGKNTWKNYPQIMLGARCVTTLGRAFAAEVMFGCYETDEADELIRDAVLTVTTTEQPQLAGTVGQRAAAAAGSTVTDAQAKHEAKVAECVDMVKALGLTPTDVIAIFKELGVEPGRISALPIDSLEKLAERLDAEAKKRGAAGGHPHVTERTEGGDEPAGKGAAQ